MLTVRCPIRFPQLVFVEEINFPTNDSKAPLYRLDWSKFEDHHKEKHEAWNKKWYPSQTIPAADFVPEEYRTIDSMHYLLDGKYIDEINRCFRQAFDEWQQNKPFDTVIRLVTLDIQKAYLYVGFKLLCDCMFSKKTDFYERGVLKTIAPHYFLVRFWQHNVGTSHVYDFSMLNKLKERKSSDVDGIVINNFVNEVEKKILERETNVYSLIVPENQRADIDKSLEAVKQEFYEQGIISYSNSRGSTGSKNAKSKAKK